VDEYIEALKSLMTEDILFMSRLKEDAQEDPQEEDRSPRRCPRTTYILL
jgi:hypothetical protein